jgi:sulfite oxidase
MASQTGRETEGLQWTDGTIANCRWTGVRLSHVLNSTGVITREHEESQTGNPRMSLYVCFASHVTACEQDEWFGASLPLESVLDEEGDVLLAFEVPVFALYHTSD